MKPVAMEQMGIRRRTVLAGATLPWLFSPTRAAPGGADAAQFFRDEETLSVHLSPDGQRVALRTVAKHRGVMLSVLDLASMQPTVLHSQETADACDVVWTNPQRLLFSIEERRVPAGRMDAGPGLFAINADGTAFRQLVERQEIGKLARVDGGGFSGALATGAAPKGVGGAAMGQQGMGFKQIADAPNIQNIREVDSDRLQAWDTYLLSPIESATTQSILMWRAKDGNGSSIELLELNARTGREKALEVPGAVVSAHADATGDLRAAVVQVGGSLSTLWRDPGTSQWRTLADCAPETGDDWAIKHIDRRGILYVSARRGQDKLALWTYDVGAARWSATPLVQSAQFDVDARVLVWQGKVAGFRFTIDAEVTQWLDRDFKNLQEQLDQLLTRTVNRIAVPAQGNPAVMLVESFSDRQPAVYLLYNRQTRKVSRLGSLRPDIAPSGMASMDLQRFAARDGLEIPVWVARPKEATSRSPTVVWLPDELYAHSGEWAWDAAQQFLLARGYAVLRPELRGTRGLGLRHLRAGVGQFGLGISDDIVDTVQWAIAQGISDPKRIAVVGAGFGAGAGLMAMARHPQLLRCAVAWSAVTDLTGWDAAKRELALDTSRPPAPGPYRGPGLGISAGELKSRSPVGHAASIRQPVLLAHGGKDRAVPIEQVEAFRKGLQVANPASEWALYKDEGHVLRDPANTIDFYQRMVRFLDSHLSI
ncbi:MAG: prolyl oligopeptidase family serine peptidase [Comamonadaceae bacterium]